MKKTHHKIEQNEQQQQQQHVEILKAVAQAWHGHYSASSKAAEAASEFDAHQRYFKGKPTRFRLEAISAKAKKQQLNTSWDFRQSLWDSYELVTVSKRLEMGLVVDDPLTALKKLRKESNNSLRNLFNRMSSRRFNEEKYTTRS